MSFLSSLLSPVWRWIAAAGAAVAAIGAIYLKGRSDAAAKAKLEDVSNANAIRKAGADARAGVDADVAAGKLRDTDGWRRD